MFRDPSRPVDVAAPPAAPPPPPPPSESDAGSIKSVSMRDDDDDFSSQGAPPSTSTKNGSANSPVHPPSRYAASSSNYYASYQNARAAPVPMITNYGVSQSQHDDRSNMDSSRSLSSRLRGDPNINPNTGQTNDEFGGIGSLREVTSRLRWLTIGCTLTALIWEGFAFPARLVVNTWEHPAEVVLGAYLAFMCLLLLGVELNAPMRDNFGVLYHPLGRAFILILMSTMCYGIHIAWWEIPLAFAFAGCSFGYIYAYAKYPEYRRWQDYNDNRIWQDIRQSVRQQTFGVDWANPIATRAAGDYLPWNKSWDETQRETQSLLHQV